MTLYKTTKIDAIGASKDTNEVVLLLADHLDWEENLLEHLTLSENKINTYVSFIESGEIAESYPRSVGRAPVIDVKFKYTPNEEAADFLAGVKEILNEAGIIFRHETTTLSP